MPPPMSHEPRILITAGPTLEHLDPVRGILNRSSGKMGLALARACRSRGLPVLVLLGPVETQIHDQFKESCQIVRYETSAELEGLLANFWPQHDLLFMAAAVSDLRPAKISITKMPRSPVSIDLEPVPDLLASLARHWPSHGIRIGFALEDSIHLVDRAKNKLKAKACHAIAANPLSTINAETVGGTWVTAKDEESFGNLTKSEYAALVLDRSLQLWAAQSG